MEPTATTILKTPLLPLSLMTNYSSTSYMGFDPRYYRCAVRLVKNE